MWTTVDSQFAFPTAWLSWSMVIADCELKLACTLSLKDDGASAMAAGPSPPLVSSTGFTPLLLTA